MLQDTLKYQLNEKKKAKNISMNVTLNPFPDDKF